MVHALLRPGSLAIACSILLACSKPDTGASPAARASAATTAPGSPAATSSSGGACDVVSCLNFSGAPGYVEGKADALPSVPPPPSGSSICGGSSKMRVNYYTTARTPDQIVAYYEKELVANGFTLKPREPGLKPCSLKLGFHKQGLEIGNITAFAGGFGVMYLGK
jgi:hypothetical protein